MLEKIIKLIEEGKNSWVIAGSLFLALVFNLEAIFNFFNNFLVRKLTVLKDSTGENGATGLTREVLQEEINSTLFRYATGINAEKHLREEIIKLHQLADGRLTYSNFRRTYLFLEIKHNGKLGICNLSLFERGRHYLNLVLSLIFFLATAVLLSTYIFIPITESRIQIIVFFYALVFLAISLLTLSQTIPMSLLKKIKFELNKNYQKFYDNQSTYKEQKVEQSSSWLDRAGMFKDDPLFDEFVEDMNTYRDKLDAKIAAYEDDSKENHIA